MQRQIIRHLTQIIRHLTPPPPSALPSSFSSASGDAQPQLDPSITPFCPPRRRDFAKVNQIQWIRAELIRSQRFSSAGSFGSTSVSRPWFQICWTFCKHFCGRLSFFTWCYFRPSVSFRSNVQSFSCVAVFGGSGGEAPSGGLGAEPPAETLC